MGKRNKMDAIRPGDILYTQMREADLTVKELAFLLDKSYGITYAMIRGYDKRKLTVEFAQKCALVFDVDPSIYFDAETACTLAENPLDPTYKKTLAQRLKELDAQRANRSKWGRKWKRQNNSN